MIGVTVKRSTVNTSKKKRARTGYKKPIVEAGEGLFATRDFRPNENILDYRYKGGVKREGDKVDWLTHEEFERRYPPTSGMPFGSGTHVLKPRSSSLYFDTARSGGIGGKANTRPGKQTARFKGSQMVAGQRGIRKGQEIFVPYSQSRSYRFGAPTVDDSRQGWMYRKK